MPEPVGPTHTTDRSHLNGQPVNEQQQEQKPPKKKRFQLTHKQKIGLAIAVICLMVVGAFFAPPEGDSNNASGDPAYVPTVVVTGLVEGQTLNHQVNFHGLQITARQARIAQKFSDDRQRGGNYTLRVDVFVKNVSNQLVGYPYAQSVRLVSADGVSVKSKYISVKPTAMPGSTQTGWIDFPLNRPAPLSSFTLMLDDHTAIPLT